MQSKVVFTLLFLFSFVIAHDALFALTHSEKQVASAVTLSYPQATETSSQADKDNLHSMLHFVAVVSLNSPLSPTPQKEREASFCLLGQTLFDEENSSRPPIA